MPPPPPNFLPANRRRQRLDPTRHLKSRELWNQVRFHATSSPSPSSSGYSRWAHSRALLRALAYELQPFRIRPCLHRVRVHFCEEDGLLRIFSSILEYAKAIFSLLKELFEFLRGQLRRTDVDSLKLLFSSSKFFLAKSALALFALRIYYYILVYLHDLLNAGPILFILTLLTLLYTIGLGENTGAGSGVPSAYSVFNRGMRRILGTVDGEELARQYAGGVVMARMNNINVRIDDFEDGGDGDVWFEEEEADEEEERNLVNEQRRRRRLERLQQQRGRNEEGGAGENADVINAAREQSREENGNDGALHSNENNIIVEDGAPGLEEEGDRPDANRWAVEGTAPAGRKSGKKARRRNLELRREMQRQRQAAAAMGFVGGAENINDERDMEARMDLG